MRVTFGKGRSAITSPGGWDSLHHRVVQWKERTCRISRGIGAKGLRGECIQRLEHEDGNAGRRVADASALLLEPKNESARLRQFFLCSWAASYPR